VGVDIFIIPANIKMVFFSAIGITPLKRHFVSKKLTSNMFFCMTLLIPPPLPATEQVSITVPMLEPSQFEQAIITKVLRSKTN